MSDVAHHLRCRRSALNPATSDDKAFLQIQLPDSFRVMPTVSWLLRVYNMEKRSMHMCMRIITAKLLRARSEYQPRYKCECQQLLANELVTQAVHVPLLSCLRNYFMCMQLTFVCACVRMRACELRVQERLS